MNEEGEQTQGCVLCRHQAGVVVWAVMGQAAPLPVTSGYPPLSISAWPQADRQPYRRGYLIK